MSCRRCQPSRGSRSQTGVGPHYVSGLRPINPRSRMSITTSPHTLAVAGVGLVIGAAAAVSASYLASVSTSDLKRRPGTAVEILDGKDGRLGGLSAAAYSTVATVHGGRSSDEVRRTIPQSRRARRLVLIDMDTAILDARTGETGAALARYGDPLYTDVPRMPGALDAVRELLTDAALDVFFVCADSLLAQKWRWLKHHFGRDAAGRLLASSDKALLLHNSSAVFVSGDASFAGRYTSDSCGTHIMISEAGALPCRDLQDSKRDSTVAARAPTDNSEACALAAATAAEATSTESKVPAAPRDTGVGTPYHAAAATAAHAASGVGAAVSARTSDSSVRRRGVSFVRIPSWTSQAWRRHIYTTRLVSACDMKGWTDGMVGMPGPPAVSGDGVSGLSSSSSSSDTVVLDAASVTS